MAQSQIVALGSRLAAPPKPIADMNAEEVLEAIDDWLDEDTSREHKVRRNLLGHVATLFSGGNPVAVGRGRGSVNALAAALENLP
jgi:hypothetical protein